MFYSLVLSAMLAITAAGFPLTQPTGPAFLVKDINQGLDPTGSYPDGLTNVNGMLFFQADDTIHGRELWKSNGSAAGTLLVKDITPGNWSTGFGIGSMVNMNGKLFFLANNGLWSSDGTTSGTIPIKTDIDDPSFLMNVQGRLFFTGDGIYQDHLWTSDGTTEGTVLLRDFGSEDYHLECLGNFTSINGTLFFYAGMGCGHSLWKSSGTAASTVMVKDFYGYDFSSRHPMTSLDNTLFFVINYNELWKSDGTEDGTVLIRDTPSSTADVRYVDQLTTVNGHLFISVQGSSVGIPEPIELWTSDGTADGFLLLKSFSPGDLFDLTDVNKKLYFVFVSDSGNCELWKSDGTRQGTVMVKDLSPSSSELKPSVFSLTNVDGVLLFTANDGVHGAEPWISYGTPDSTVMVQDIAPGDTGSRPHSYTIAGSFVFFSANDGSTGPELWAIPLERLKLHIFLPMIIQ